MPRSALIFLVSILAASLQAGPDQDFADANRLYESGDFAKAAAAYEKIASDQLSPDLFYNLGAAKQRAGEAGAAVLWMRRALVLDSGLAEARQSLNFLRSRLGFLEFENGPLDRFIARLPAAFPKWTIATAGWIAGIALAMAFLVPRFRPNRTALVTLAIVALLLVILGWRAGIHRTQHIAFENFATVISPETAALTSPTPDAKAVITLPPGSEVRLLQETGAWTYVEIPGDLRGWVRSESVAPIWPPSASKS